MIRRAKVISVDDPLNLGRVKAKLLGVRHDRYARLPWAWPCTMMAGPGYGVYFLPRVGDEVWVDRTDTGDWIYLGFSWRGDIGKPSEGSPSSRVIKTPAGHRVVLDDSGDVKVKNGSGNSLILRANGDIVLGGSGGEKRLLTEDFLKHYDKHKHYETGNITGVPDVLSDLMSGIKTDKTKAK